jgi:hypothetical protein
MNFYNYIIQKARSGFCNHASGIKKLSIISAEETLLRLY